MPRRKLPPALRLRSGAHRPAVEGRCLICHEGNAPGHPAGEGPEFSRRFGGAPELCYACHERAGDRWADADAMHPPFAEGRCEACHDLHGSPHRALLRVPFPVEISLLYREGLYDLCWGCHDRGMILDERSRTVTAFRTGDRNLHFLHVNRNRRWKGENCKACHQLHASRDLYTDQGYRLVGNWHKHDSTRLPLQYSLTSTGGTCVPGCHREQSYNRGDDGPKEKGIPHGR